MPVGTSFAQEVAQAGYARQPWTGDCDPNTGAVTLTFGDNKECTITNIAIAPTLKVIKHLDPTGDPATVNATKTSLADIGSDKATDLNTVNIAAVRTPQPRTPQTRMK